MRGLNPNGLRRAAPATIALAGLCLVAAQPASAVDPCTAAGGVPGSDGPAQTCTFTVANSAGLPAYTFAVPANACAVTITAYGAQGGGMGTSTGGKGAEADGTFSALAGQTLTIVVAGAGNTSTTGGYPDGAGAQVNAAGGGGGSRVSAGSLLVLAGGGGGAAGAVSNGGLGGNGGNAGAAGTSGGGITSGDHNQFSVVGGSPGGAASNVAGGSAGNGGHTVGTCNTGSSGGAAGTAGSNVGGGTGGFGFANNSGGGGGGGLFGGGGAGSGARCVTAGFGTLTSAGGGGGGGSSFVDSSATVSHINDGANAPQTGAGAVVVGYTPAAVPNLIKDGGFEKPVEPAGNTTITAPGKVGPWHVTTGSVDVAHDYWQNAAGSQSLDLAGLATGAVAQSFTLPATGTFTARYRYAGNPDCGPVVKHLLVSLDSPSWGSPVTATKTFDVTGHGLGNIGWKGGSISFPGTSGDLVTLTFADQSGVTFCGATLDAVSVKQTA